MIEDLSKPTTVTIKNGHGEYSVTVDYTGVAMDDMIKDLIVPVLLATGYHPDTVKDYIDGGGYGYTT